jgi:hypothetical protein
LRVEGKANQQGKGDSDHFHGCVSNLF